MGTMIARAASSRVPLTRELLEDLYLDQGCTCRQIADHCGYASTSAIVRALERAGIPTRNSRKRPHIPTQPREVLETLYIAQGLSTRAIAAEVGYNSHGQVMLDLKSYGIPLRPRAGPRPRTVLALTEEFLRDRYCDKGWSAVRIAKETGCTAETVGLAITRHGIPVRAATPAPEQALTRREMEELHHRQGLTIAEIAVRFGTHRLRISRRAAELGVTVRKHHRSRGASVPAGGEGRLAALYARRDVSRVLKRHGVPRRDAPDAAVHAVALHGRLLRDLYTSCGLSSVAIGLLLARTSAAVMRALRAEGIQVRPPPPTRPPRPARPPAPQGTPLTRELLLELYVGQNLTLRQVAKRCGWRSGTPVRTALRREQIPLRPTTVPRREVELTRELLEDLYVTRGLSARAIVDMIGDYSVTTVFHALDREGIPTRGPRYTSKTPMPELTESLLRQLYVDERLRVHEIAARLGYARAAVSRALRAHGLVVERRRGRPRERRREVDRATLEELYVHQDLSAEAVGAELGVSGVFVLKRLHDYGIPVRRNRWERPAENQARLDRLRKDRRVRAALIRAGVRPWREDGTPIQETPLPATFLETVYEQLGLSLFDIELVTGRPERSVQSDLTAAGIPVRARVGYRGQRPSTGA